MTQPETRAMQSDAQPDDQARIVAEEERTLARIQKYVESRGIREVREGLNYDEELLSLRDQIDEGSQAHAHTWDDILHAYGTDAPDGVRLTVVNRIENPEPD